MNQDLPLKLLPLLQRLEEGKVDLEKDHFHDPGSVSVGGARLRCWKRGWSWKSVFS